MKAGQATIVYRDPETGNTGWYIIPESYVDSSKRTARYNGWPVIAVLRPKLEKSE